jgi:excisionase family DNA binding protein
MVSAASRPVRALVVGETGPAVVLAGQVCDYLERAADLRKIREHTRLDDPDVYWALVELRRCALAWQARHLLMSPTRHEPARNRDTTPLSELVSTSQAATLAGTSARTIQRAIEARQLPASRAGGRWLITRTDLDRYRARRR